MALEEINNGERPASFNIGLAKRWIKAAIINAINAKRWIKEHPDLAFQNKAEIIDRLKLEIFLAKADGIDSKDEDSEEEIENEDSEDEDSDEESEDENSDKNWEKMTNMEFEAKRVFALFTVINNVILQADKMNLVQFICRIGYLEVLRMICDKEMKDAEGKINSNGQYLWKGNFTGYSNLIDLLKYVIDNQCPPKCIQCIAEKIYGTLHTIYNGKKCIESSQFVSIEKRLRQPISVMEECLKKAIQFGYTGTVLIALGGDINYCIRMMAKELFDIGYNPEITGAYSMIKETAADVISSWVENKRKQIVKIHVQYLLDQGISMDISKMSKNDLISELENNEIKIMYKKKITENQIVEILEKKVGKDAVRMRLNKNVVGAFISVLFFKYQEVVIQGKERGYFTVKISNRDKYLKREECYKLNNLSYGECVEGVVLRLIKSLNISNTQNIDWLFREMLANIINDDGKLKKLQSVCTTICKEPMQRLLNGLEVSKDMENVLKFVGVEKYSSQVDKGNDLSIENIPSTSSSEERTFNFSTTSSRQSSDSTITH